MADVLGFKETTKHDDALLLARRYESFLSQIPATGMVTSLTRVSEAGEPQILASADVVPDHQVFSDTVLLWVLLPPTGGQSADEPPTFDPNVSLLFDVDDRVMNSFVSIPRLILVGLQMDLPLRIGVGFGECVIDPNERIYVGPAILKAHEAEQRQNWMGVEYHSTSIDAIRKDIQLFEPLKKFGYLREDHIPTKDGNRRWCLSKLAARQKYSPGWTANWPLIASSNCGDKDVEERLIKNKENAPKRDKVKWVNALEFFHRCRSERTTHKP